MGELDPVDQSTVPDTSMTSQAIPTSTVTEDKSNLTADHAEEENKRDSSGEPQDTRRRLHTSLAYQLCLYILFPVLLAIATWRLIGLDEGSMICHQDLSNGEALLCRPRCGPRQFSLVWMEQCRPWLTCDEIESTDFEILRPLANGAVKMVHLVQWGDHQVVYNTLLNGAYEDDFRHGLSMLAQLQGNPFVTQVLGYCRNSFVTQYHRLGSAENLETLLSSERYSRYNTLKTRFQLCLDYAAIVQFLHTSPIGMRVMCDSNDLTKTLNQYLLTSDLRLVVNDLDALPEVNRKRGVLVRCGHRAIFGSFAAPEQVWPYDDREYSDALMAPYDEKTDIWKIPEVCNHFLGQIPGSDSIRFHLFGIHKECKQEDPTRRPNASAVLEQYRDVWDEFGF